MKKVFFLIGIVILGAILSCTGTSEERNVPGEEPSSITIHSPWEGQDLTLGMHIPITWTSSKQMDSFEIYLVRAVSSARSGPLGVRVARAAGPPTWLLGRYTPPEVSAGCSTECSISWIVGSPLEEGIRSSRAITAGRYFLLIIGRKVELSPSTPENVFDEHRTSAEAYTGIFFISEQ